MKSVGVGNRLTMIWAAMRYMFHTCLNLHALLQIREDRAE